MSRELLRLEHHSVTELVLVASPGDPGRAANLPGPRPLVVDSALQDLRLGKPERGSFGLFILVNNLALAEIDTQEGVAANQPRPTIALAFPGEHIGDLDPHRDEMAKLLQSVYRGALGVNDGGLLLHYWQVTENDCHRDSHEDRRSDDQYNVLHRF